MTQLTTFMLAVCLIAPTLQAQPKVELPYPEASTFMPPKNPDLFFDSETVTVRDEITGQPLNFYLMTSPDFTIETPPMEDWIVDKSDRSHSMVVKHTLVEDIEFTFDCYEKDSWPEITPKLIQSKINQQAFLLTKQGFNRFTVITEEDDFTATLPTRKFQMANGEYVEVLKRGRVKPLRVADQYLYDLIAEKIDPNGKVTEQVMIHDNICVHPMGYILEVRIQGDPKATTSIKSWLMGFLRHSQENAGLLDLRNERT